MSCGLLAYTQYSILAAPRHILSTRFKLTSPLVTGLFYLAPATGFLFGTVIGGRYSDMTVRKWIAKRGERLPQDRLRSGMVAFLFIIPVASLVYGWGLQSNSLPTSKGGLALPIVTTFFTAMGLLTAFASLNTYCAGKFLVELKVWTGADGYCRSDTEEAERGYCRQVHDTVLLLGICVCGINTFNRGNWHRTRHHNRCVLDLIP